jgi:hypothetical protein
MTAKPNHICTRPYYKAFAANRLQSEEERVQVPLMTATESSIGTIRRNDINWGDGTTDTYNSSVTSATHVFTKTGITDIQFAAWVYNTATDTYGTYDAPAQPVAIGNIGVTATALSFTASASTDVFAITSNGTDTIITQNGTTIEDEPTEDILALSIAGGSAAMNMQ